MPRQAMLLVIGLFFGFGGGFLLAAANGITLDGHDHGTDHHSDHGAQAGHAVAGHDHDALLDVSGEGAVPSLTLALHPDMGSAMNLEIRAANFRFAPERVNGPHHPGTGHAHVYLDGRKIARVYGHWLHLPDLPESGGEIHVTLNANSHEGLADGARPIEARIAVPAR